MDMAKLTVSNYHIYFKEIWMLTAKIGMLTAKMNSLSKKILQISTGENC